MRRVVVRYLVDIVLPSALATLAVGVGLLAGHHPAVFLLAAAAAAVAVWPGRSKSATARTAPRLVAALAVVVGYASAVTMPDWPLLIAGGSRDRRPGWRHPVGRHSAPVPSSLRGVEIPGYEVVRSR